MLASRCAFCLKARSWLTMADSSLPYVNFRDLSQRSFKDRQLSISEASHAGCGRCKGRGGAIGEDPVLPLPQRLYLTKSWLAVKKAAYVGVLVSFKVSLDEHRLR